jgi:hypothetical protein
MKSTSAINEAEIRLRSKILTQGLLVGSSFGNTLKMPENSEQFVNKLDILGGNFPILKNTFDTTSITSKNEINALNKEVDAFNKEVNNFVFVDPENKDLVEKIINSFKIL